ncbi:head-tail connector protein [Kozakia baliensis]|uniref:Uncharacterized protein n=1 Tax=Kozakia baliensis TaxID=153496 RepID=A0A1D8UTI5_9PROT|nr:head-tail connector protein [Kozakia baliensis]AOX16926.1 hypothetical protein A0U89_07010 [Kozakia baliensis]GBR25562.1 hypothetical protein AA0488_0683 [Kozakia baliensis NRIC 0488]GEL64026.1 hypothetical protein KBA01_13120 [Kozakia baliensis]
MPSTLSLRIVTPPVNPAADLQTVKRHLRIDHDEDDDLIAGYIQAATAWVESYLGRALVSTQFLQAVGEQPYAGAWPMLPTPFLILPLALSWPPLQSQAYRILRSPLISIDSVQLVDPNDGSSTDISPAQYALDINSEPSRLWLDNAMPLQRRESLLVKFTAGYGPDTADVPKPIQLSIAMLVAYYYENRGDMEMSEPPAAVEALLVMYRLVWFGA